MSSTLESGMVDSLVKAYMVRRSVMASRKGVAAPGPCWEDIGSFSCVEMWRVKRGIREVVGS